MTKPQGTEISRPRRGRPRRDEAGQVEDRVLEAATALFLELGYGRTTLDEVSKRSHTSKQTLYGRFANKKILFAAVVTRSIQMMYENMEPPPSQSGVKDRVRHVGKQLAENLLLPRCVALMRITAAEAENFPELALMGYRESLEGSVKCVARAITTDESVQAATAATVAATRFVEAALHPLCYQATFGCDPATLLAKCSEDVEDAILLLTAKGMLPD